LTFIPQLGIRLHKCLTLKRILDSHLGLSRYVCHNMKTELRDQARKWKPYRVIIYHLQHTVEDVPTQAKRHPHTQSIQKFIPLQNKLTTTSYGP
jgi:hypothetical protein